MLGPPLEIASMVSLQLFFLATVKPVCVKMVANVVRSLILLLTSLVCATWATVDTKLTGTWTSKSRQVVTGSVGTHRF